MLTNNLILSAFGLLVTTILTCIGYLIKKNVDRYYDLQKVKEEKAEEHANRLSGKMEEISHSVNALTLRSNHYFEEVSKGAQVLAETVRRVDKIEWHVFPDKKKNNGNNHQD